MEEEVAGSALLSQNSGQNKRQANTHPHARPHCAGVFANRLGVVVAGESAWVQGTDANRQKQCGVSVETDGVGTASINTRIHVCTYVRFV